MTLNNSMSITPMPPQMAKGGRFEHGSVLGGKTRSARVSSQWKSTLLYLAQTKVGDRNAVNELRENTQSLEKAEWPFAAAELFLGQRSPEATLAATSNFEERCEAEFYLAEFDESQGLKFEAIQAMQAGAACPIKLVERHLAEAELQRIGAN
jgi:lipoprotein NlpI